MIYLFWPQNKKNIFPPQKNHLRYSPFDIYLCKPRFRWWRGESRMLLLLMRMEEHGINVFG